MLLCYVLVFRNGVNTQELKRSFKLGVAKYFFQCTGDSSISWLLSEYVEYHFTEFADSFCDYHPQIEEDLRDILSMGSDLENAKLFVSLDLPGLSKAKHVSLPGLKFLPQGTKGFIAS